MKLRYLSMCSGIEVTSLAWRPLGWEPVAFAEIEPFPCAVLAHHYPGVPNLGDMTGIDGTQFTGRVDVMVAGTPCQAFSVAGLRDGLSDSRGNLTLKFVELANAIKPSVAVIWENVPGVLSMRDNAFGCFLAGLAGSDGPLVPARPGRWPDAGLVFGPIRAIAWRVLDAQYFGLAQRRRRVFVVACPRNGLNPAEILFEFDGVRRDTPPRREARADIAGTLEASTGRSRGAGTSSGACVEVCQSLTRSFGSGGPDDNKAQAGFYVSQYGDVAAPLTSEGADASSCADRGPTVVAATPAQSAFGGNNTSGSVDVATACRAKGGTGHGDFESETFVLCRPTHDVAPAIAFTERGRAEGRTFECQEEQAYCLANPSSGGRTHSRQIMTPQMQVRRLTPMECERLQGIPDNYTLIPYKRLAGLPTNIIRRSYRRYLARMARQGKPPLPLGDLLKCADGPRYKAIGNGMARNVMQWIGERIEKALATKGVPHACDSACGLEMPNQAATAGGLRVSDLGLGECGHGPSAYRAGSAERPAPLSLLDLGVA